MGINASDIAGLVKKVTAKHAKQVKAEERDRRAASRRKYMYCGRVNFTEVAGTIFPKAYAHASGDGKYPASKRQIYYAARQMFLDATARQITQQRCNALLVQYMNQWPEKTAGWKITADARGTLLIPNTHKETRVPCGTIEIDRHLGSLDASHEPATPMESPLQWPSLAAGQRYQAVLYIEKEGFEPLLKAARIPERYELAIVSCKGHSVVAARKFVDRVCKVNGGVPLLIVHDMDMYGFQIGARLTSVSRQAVEEGRVTYRFQNEINSVDLGLRLEDAIRYDLHPEDCKPPSRIPADLGCTSEEIAFLKSGRRIELNALTAPQFIEWIETQIQAAGITERMVPADSVLEDAYRRAVVTVRTNEAVRRAFSRAVKESKSAQLPGDLEELIRERMKERDQPWDIALAGIVKDQLGEQGK